MSSSGRITHSAISTAPNERALIPKAGATPQAPMMRPATPGPTRRAPLKVVALRPTALGSSRLGTISDTKAWRAGLSNATTMPPTAALR